VRSALGVFYSGDSSSQVRQRDAVSTENGDGGLEDHRNRSAVADFQFDVAGKR
jgi:hypothetical protein